MSLIYLLDTNTISEPLKPAPHPQVMARLERCYSQIALPALAVYELINGAYQLPESKKRLKILRYVENILAELPVLSYTQTAALWHGQETARFFLVPKRCLGIHSWMRCILCRCRPRRGQDGIPK